MLQISQCTTQEIKETAKFYDDAVLFLEQHINYPKWVSHQYPSIEDVKRRTEEQNLFLCREDEKLAGAFVLNEDPDGEYEKGQWQCEAAKGEYLVIHMLAVAPKLQGHGIGATMIQYAVDFAVRNGYREIRLDVVPGNTPAIRLYERFGFVFAGEYDLGRNKPDIPTFQLFEKVL